MSARLNWLSQTATCSGVQGWSFSNHPFAAGLLATRPFGARESTPKRTFAGAIDWPGWRRSGRDAAAARQALVDYGPRYAR
jgi:hypothetical protein